MGKHKEGKKHKKGSQFVIRVDKSERDAFVSLCETLDTSAAREIRKFMRAWVAAHTPAAPADAEEAAPVETPTELSAEVRGETQSADEREPDAPAADTAKAAKPKKRRKDAAPVA